jgi:hypothetical protein
MGDANPQNPGRWPRMRWQARRSRLPRDSNESAAAGPYGDGIEQIAYPCREALLRDRLLDHLDARIEPTLVDNGISGITRRKQNFETGSPILCLVRQLSTVDAG